MCIGMQFSFLDNSGCLQLKSWDVCFTYQGESLILNVKVCSDLLKYKRTGKNNFRTPKHVFFPTPETFGITEWADFIEYCLPLNLEPCVSRHSGAPSQRPMVSFCFLLVTLGHAVFLKRFYLASKTLAFLGQPYLRVVCGGNLQGMAITHCCT